MKTKNYLLIIFLIILLSTFFIFFKFKESFTVELIIYYYDIISLYISKNFIKSIFLFISAYAVLVLLNFPAVSILSLAGGLFYGTFLGGILVSFAATIGAFLFFILAKYFFYDFFKKKVLSYLSKLEFYFKKHEMGFLFLIRISGMPFFIQNLVLVFLGANPVKFLLTTLFGIMPFTFIFTNIGSNIDSIIKSGDTFGIHLFLEPKYIIPILFLASLTILGMFFKSRLKL